LQKNKCADKIRLNLLLQKNKFADEELNLVTIAINLLIKKNKFADKNNNFAAKKE